MGRRTSRELGGGVRALGALLALADARRDRRLVLLLLLVLVGVALTALVAAATVVARLLLAHLHKNDGIFNIRNAIPTANRAKTRETSDKEEQCGSQNRIVTLKKQNNNKFKDKSVAFGDVRNDDFKRESAHNLYIACAFVMLVCCYSRNGIILFFLNFYFFCQLIIIIFKFIFFINYTLET